MIAPVKTRMSAVALAAALLLVGAATAWAEFVVEGSPYTVGDDPLSLNAGDFNGDGRPDVATINGTSSNVSVYLRQAGGGFAQEAGSPFGVGAGPSGAAVGDYNGDGRVDLAVSSFNAPGGVTVLLRQAGGGFAQESGSPFGSGTGMHAVVAGDFNGDGLLDLAATRSTGQLVLLTRNPGGGFTEGQSITAGATPVAIAVGDYNGDGLTDLATANRGGDSVTVLLRSGATFATEGTFAVGDDPIGIVAADFDGNGRADLAVTNAVPGTVSAFLRNAANTGFDAESPISVSASPVGIDAADFNRDGRPDLAVAANAGAVNVLHRNAAGGFTLDQSISIAGAVNDVVASDFDGDSRPDLAASSYTGATADSFTAMLNPGPPAPPPGPPPLPAPVAGKTVNVKPVSGTVRIRRPGRRRFVTLTAEAQTPVGSSVDTRKGRISITAAQGAGKTASADFFDGLFKLTQTKGRKPLATLTLTEKLSCPKAGRAIAAAKKKKRRLWGDGKGRFRTKGKHSAATVVGTRWLVEDRCKSTLTRVTRGRVKVRDFVKKKTVTVRAGKRYTARAKRR
jgi:hypothetical protein